MPGILAGVALADGREIVLLQKGLHARDDRRQGCALRRAQVKEHAHRARAGAHAHLRKVRVDQRRKLRRRADPGTCGRVPAVQARQRHGGAVAGERQRLDQILEKRRLRHACPQRGDGVKVHQVCRAALAKPRLHQQMLVVAQQVGAAGQPVADGAGLADLLAQLDALFVHHADQLAEGHAGLEYAPDLVEREALALQALDDAQHLHILDGELAEAAGRRAVRREQPLLLVIAQRFRREPVGDGERTDGYLHGEPPRSSAVWDTIDNFKTKFENRLDSQAA